MMKPGGVLVLSVLLPLTAQCPGRALAADVPPFSAEQTAQFLAELYRKEPEEPNNFRSTLLQSIAAIGPRASSTLYTLFLDGDAALKLDVLKHLTELHRKNETDLHAYYVLTRILGDGTLSPQYRYLALKALNLPKDPRVETSAVSAALSAFSVFEKVDVDWTLHDKVKEALLQKTAADRAASHVLRSAAAQAIAAIARDLEP